MDAATVPRLPISEVIPNVDDTRANASNANQDPFKFSHGLTGVDQPSNYFFVHILAATALVPMLLALVHRLYTAIRNETRRTAVTRSSHENQRWKIDRYRCWSRIKRHFLYAPIWTRRHDRKPGAFSIATLPTRPVALIIGIYTVSNIAYCVAIPSQPRPQAFAEFRGRCGTLAAFNLVLATLFALRNNPLISIIHVSYDTFNLFHRWTARLVVLESIAHVSAFAYNAYEVTYNGHGGWDNIAWILQHSLSYRTGLTAFVAFGLLTVHSVGPLRHAFYETFLTVHRLGVVIAVSGLYFHLARHALPQLPWMYIIITLLVLEPVVRASRILYYNFSWKQRSWTQVTLEALPGEATRVTFSLPRSWNMKPGSHVHVYLPKIALWSSHPFSIAWSQRLGYACLGSEKHTSTNEVEDLTIEAGPGTVSCVVRARTGMTRALFDLASRARQDSVSLWGAVEGPYGGYHSLDSYGTVVLFAAGVGITHQLSFVRHLLERQIVNAVATRMLLLVWCIPTIEALRWIEPWLEEMSAMKHFHEMLRIHLYVSRPNTLDLENRPVPKYISVRLQRCDPEKVVDQEVLAQVGAMVVSVCGPSRFNESVREAVRKRVCIRSIDFIEEAFSY